MGKHENMLVGVEIDFEAACGSDIVTLPFELENDDLNQTVTDECVKSIGPGSFLKRPVDSSGAMDGFTVDDKEYDEFGGLSVFTISEDGDDLAL